MARKLLKALGGIAFLALLLLMGGLFHQAAIRPGHEPGPAPLPEPQHVAEALLSTETSSYDAVGTVRSRTRIEISARVPGQLVEVLVDVGDLVSKGQLVASLDDREPTARLAQARSQLTGARAAARQAEAHHERIEALRQKEAATAEQSETAESRWRQAKAAMSVAEQGVRAAHVALAYMRIESPLEGVVAERRADPGDVVAPGRGIVIVHDRRVLRLEADVPERLVGAAEVGREVSAYLAGLDRTVETVIDEVVPTSDPRTRSFLVRATLPELAGLRPGMFGRLRIPVGEREVVLVPDAAIRRVGQLQMILVRHDDRWVRSHVTVGRLIRDQREVLSGLSGGEFVGWDD